MVDLVCMQKVIEVLKNGGAGVLPTDTLYGVVASAFSEEAISRIYSLKGRDENKPFIILISSINDLGKFGVKLSEKQKKFLKSVWPGRVSVVLKCALKKFEYLHRGGKTLAFRLPADDALIGLLSKTGPLVAPSANPKGMPPAATATAAKNYFGKKLDFYISGGRREGLPSMVVSLVGKEPRILRGALLSLKS